MKRVRTVVLDNEAVQALLDVRHRKHRRVNAFLLVIINDRRVHAGAVQLVVPTSVRVEAGWNRTDPRAAVINHLSIRDHPLDERAANLAVELRTTLEISIADGHLGVVLQQTPGPHTVLTSDAGAVRRISEHLGVPTAILTV